MKHHSKLRRWGKLLSWILATALFCAHLEGIAVVKAAGPSVISIGSADELAKIGTDSNYPMTGDYVLSADIDLSGREWIPMGGYIGNKGTCNPAEANVFSGTFDGQGHVISGLTIQLDGSIQPGDRYGQVGLFSVIGSNNASDYAEVKNVIFTDVEIRTDFSDGLAAVGTLAGEVNGCARVSNIAVLNGTLTVNPSAVCDTVGAGGLIGECRTADAMGNGNIFVTDCYNGADLFASGTRADLIYAGGIIGRVAKSACGSIAQCVNTGMVQYDGYDAFAIASAESADEAYLTTLANCYFPSELEQLPSGQAVAVPDSELLGGTLPGNLPAEVWQAEPGCYPVPAFCYQSSAAGMIYLSGLALGFAEGEAASGVKTVVSLPQAAGSQALTWTSSNTLALSIEGDRAVAHPSEIGMNTVVTLTAQTEGGYSRSFKLTVLTDREQAASFDQDYAQVGTPLTVSVSNTGGMDLQYQWSVDGAQVSGNGNSYTPVQADLEKFISVVITAGEQSVRWELSIYCSELPVVYVDTDDGQGIDSNTVAKDAHMRIQGNAEFNNPKNWYDGKTTIKGRGNSTWSQAVAWNVKKPYKLKLSSKENLLGLGTGKNKHWVLLANMIDHTNMRNQLVHSFARDIGVKPAIGTTSVVLVLNGEYQGIYELSEHIRVGKARVDIHEWEGLADDIAEAICEKETTLKLSSLETAMEEDLSWVASGVFQYQGKEYVISEYYADAIPEVTGGFLLDMDFRSTSDQYKYISTFQTTNGMPMFFRAPEYAKTSQAMVDYARNYLNAYEAALKNQEFTTTFQNKTVHYTDLFDMDSLLRYWLVCEYTNNWDSMKNSSYLYKDLEGKAKMGPAWDYDWAWGNINMYSMTGPFVYDQWHTVLTGMDTNIGGFGEQAYQKQQWYRYLVKDPYFVAKAYELYNECRPTVIEDMIKSGGLIDTWEQKYQSASDKDGQKWSYTYGWYQGKAFVNGTVVDTQSQNYNDAIASMKTFIQKRVDWFDTQFTSVEKLYTSLGNQLSKQISVSAVKAKDGTIKVTAETGSSRVASVAFLVNSKKVSAAGQSLFPVIDGKASISIDAAMLEEPEDAIQAIQVLGASTNQEYISGMMNFTAFTKATMEQEPGGDDKPKELTGKVTVTSSRAGEVSHPGDKLTAALTETNNSGTLQYQWYAGEEAVNGATASTYQLTEQEIGKTLSVSVTSTVETGTICGTYAGRVEKEEIIPKPEELTGKVTVTSSRAGKASYPGDKLTAAVNGTNNSGTLQYQWYAGQEKISGATASTYTLTEGEIGKTLSVSITSTIETGTIRGTYAGSIQRAPQKPIRASKVTLSVTSKKLYAYQTLQLKAKVTPAAASQKVMYSVDKKSIVSVSQSGKVTAKSPGTAKITVKATDGSGVKAVCKVTVKKPVIKVSGKSTVKPKKSITLTAKTYGLKGKVTWKLDAKGKKLLKLNKKSGAKVKLTAKKKTGKAKLTITCGKKKVTKTIRVKK
ncbi:CotH kinase family protein [Lachnospiraceae bacterium 29-84]